MTLRRLPTRAAARIRRPLAAAILVIALAVAAASLACAERDRDRDAGPAIDAPRSQPVAYTQAFVQDAIDRYEADGLENALAYYSSEDSIDGQWYVFIADEDGAIVAHPSQDLVGVHLSDVTTTNDYPSGQMVLDSASEDGAWSSYASVNPANGRTQTKHAWLIEHDGLLFGSGWHEDRPRRSNQPRYTQFLVEQALNLYDASGVDAAADYYNNPVSLDGQWYVFIADEGGTLIAHVNPDLVGVHLSDVKGSNGYPSGQIIHDVADEDGEWSGYTFFNPTTGRSQSKHSWVIEHDGLIFGSGWYEDGPRKSDQPAYTQSFVERALNLYDASGLDVAINYYNDSVSVDDEWYVFIVDTATGRTVSHYRPEIRDRDPSQRVDSTGYFYGDDLLAAQEDGKWVQYTFRDPSTGDERQKHTWAVRHGDYIFASGWYD